jgi:AraC-like DNA-binding protein
MRNTNNQYSSNFYLFPGHILYIGNLPVPKFHSHHVMEIFIGFDKPVNLITENGIYQNQILLIRSDIPHTISESWDKMIIIVLDPETTIAKKLAAKYLENKNVASLDIDLQSDVINRYFINPSSNGAEEVYHSIIDSFTVTENIQLKNDKRIIKALSYIQSLEIKKISSGKIAKHVGLSEGRLIHLFKEQVGIPLRKYLLWLRIIDALIAVYSGESLSSAAHKAEFTDYAHLSKSFSAMFGYSLSMFSKNVKYTINTSK